MSKLDEIADYAEHHDFAAEMEQGSWEAGTDVDPMITTSVRLPKSLLDWVRRSAAAQHVRPSVLIRDRRRRGPRRTGGTPRTCRLPRHAGVISEVSGEGLGNVILRADNCPGPFACRRCTPRASG
jgi:hypothetical protein